MTQTGPLFAWTGRTPTSAFMLSTSLCEIRIEACNSRDQLGFDLAFDARLPSGAAGWPSLGKLAESSLVAIE